jgi:hypothetical protein
MHSKTFYSITLKSTLILSSIYVSPCFFYVFQIITWMFSIIKTYTAPCVGPISLSLHHDILCSYLKPWKVRAEIYIKIVSPTKYGSIFKGPSGTLCNRVQRHPVEERAAVTKHSSRREHGFMGMHKTNGMVTGSESLHFVPLSSLTSLYFKLMLI